MANSHCNNRDGSLYSHKPSRMTIKILNLYAGIGGNRKLWDGDIEVTAIENNKEIAKIYQDFFPNDKVIVCDAHQYLLEHFEEYDFIWSSPPCPTHSQMKVFMVKSQKGWNKDRKASYPDMKLYEEIILLKHFFKGKWVVENVRSYYDPLIKPQEIQRHYIWSNFNVGNIKLKRGNIAKKHTNDVAEYYGVDNLDKYSLKTFRKDQAVRNCVHPKLGLHIFNMAFKEPQKTLT